MNQPTDPQQALRNSESGEAGEIKDRANQVPETGSATAQTVQSEDRHFFLRSLSEALRGLREPEQIACEAARLLGEYLRADFVLYLETGREDVVRGQYVREAAGLREQKLPSMFGERTGPRGSDGEPVMVSDVESDSRYDEDHRAA